MRLPQKPSRKVRIVKEHIPGGLLARDDSVFVSVARADIVHVQGSTGRELWRVPAEKSWVTSLAEDVLLVTNGASTTARGISVETGKTLYALSARSIRLWRNRWMLRNDDGIVVVNPSTGEVLETKAPLPFLPSDGGLTRIEGDVMLYQAENNTQVVAYDLSRQKFLWSRPLRREIAEQLACEVSYITLRPVDPDRFLAIVDGHVLGCSLANGSILWRRAAPFVRPFGPPMVVEQGRVYWMTSVRQHDAEGNLLLANRPAPFRLSCIDVATGEALYDVESPERTAMDVPSWPVVHAGHIAFGETFTSQGLITLHRLEDGKLVWSYRYKTGVFSPEMTDRGLFVCSGDGNLLIFDAV